MIGLQELDRVFRAAEAAGDLDGCAACQVQLFELLHLHPELVEAPEVKYQDASQLVHLVAAAMMALERGDGQLAEFYLRHFPQRMIGAPWCLPSYRFVLAVLAYRRGDILTAQELLAEHLRQYPQDERAWLYAGNTFLLQGAFRRAAVDYQKALSRNAYVREAEKNLQLAVRCMMMPPNVSHEEPLEPSPELGVRAEDWASVRQLPIFINCRDRVECLAKLVDWLLSAGYTNLILLDNASTYPPLLAYYDRIRSERVRVVMLGENLGHTALWDSGMLDLLEVRTPYVYTDPDVLPGEACPPSFLQEFVRLLAAHPTFMKVGAALRYDDLVFEDRAGTKERESLFYRVPLEKDVYFAVVDTTFARYRNARFYHLGPAVRVAGAYAFRHLPWYYEAGRVPEDERYYRAHANASASLAAFQKEKSRGVTS